MKKKNKFNKHKKFIARLGNKLSRLKLSASQGNTDAKHEFKMWSEIRGRHVSKTKWLASHTYKKIYCIDEEI